MMDTLRSETTKARSTQLLTWCLGLAVLLPPALAALLGLAMAQRESYCATPGNTCRNTLEPPGEVVATIGVLGDGIPGAAFTVLTLFAAALLLVEIRYNTISTTFLVTSRRSVVSYAKVLLVVLVSLPVAFIATVLSGIAFDLTAGLAGSRVEPLSPAAFGIALRSAVVVALFSVVAYGVAALTRQVAVTIAVVIAWPNFGETLLPVVVPGGDDLVRFLPVANARNFVGLDAGPVPWSELTSGLYITALAAAVVALGIWRLDRADLSRA